MATKLREAEVAHFSLEGRNPPGPRQALTSLVLNRLIPGGMSVLRRVRPVWKVPGRDLVVVTGFDAVQEVFSRQHDFEVPYEERVELITSTASSSPCRTPTSTTRCTTGSHNSSAPTTPAR